MKNVFCFFLFLSQLAASAQFPFSPASPVDYMWKFAGNAGLSEDRAEDISLAVGPSGEPYLTYTDFAHAFRATVMKFDGNN